MHYNLSGWEWLREFLERHGVHAHLADSNNGELIEAATCRAIAQAIRDHAAEYDKAFGLNRAENAARKWAESGGFAQH